MASAGLNAGGGDPETDAALREALKQFRKKISYGDLERFQTGSVMQLKHECYLIQEDQERLAALSNLRRIEQFICKLQELQVILKEFSKDESFTSYIWGAMKFLIRTASSTLKDGLDGMLSAYEEIGQSIPRLEGLEVLFLEVPGLRRCLAALYADLLKFHSGAYKCFTQFSEKGRKKIFKSAWKEFEKHDLCHLVVMVKKHKGVVEYGKQFLTRPQLATHSALIAPEDLREVRRKVSEYENDCDKEEQEHERRESKRRDEQFELALQWISANQYPSDATHEKLCIERKQYEGTYEWITDVPSVANWLNEPTQTHPVLWMNGHMGVGKSTLASYLVEKCVKDTPAGASFKATYFYCDGRNPDARTFLSISRGLIHRQLMHIQNVEKFRHLVAYCCDKKTNSGHTHLKDEATAESLLKTFFEIIPDQYIIVDGLDECEKPVIQLTLRTLCSVVTQQDTIEPGRLRLLIISRDLIEVKRLLSTEQTNADIFKIEAEHNAEAIELYVKLRTARFNPRFELSEEKRQEIINKTVKAAKGAQGMFLFARLTLDHLGKSSTIRTLDRRLKEDHFPKTIGDAYDRLLESIKQSLDDDELWDKARCIFGWLTCAGRLLHWHEIQAIATIERHDDEGQIQVKRDRFVLDVQEFCGTLIHVSPGNKVELIHHTAHDYILKSQHVNEQEVQFDLATLCMEYLTFPCFGRGISDHARKKFASEGLYAFQDYAVSKWFYHIAAVLKIEDLTVDGPKSERFANVLDEFTTRYQDSVDDMDSPPSSAASETSHIDLEKVKEQAIRDCKSLEGRPFHEMILNLWIHISKHEKDTIDKRNKPCLKEMEKVLQDNRRVIEALERSRDLHEIYGENLYKCPKTRCDFFHEGLKDDDHRKHHIARHDRPFTCEFSGCTMAEAGFISNKDLERHKKGYHSDVVDGQSPFPLRTRQSSEAKFECKICPKKFTRKINLDGHTRSHFGDRPYVCQACSKKFTRLNDLRRHEKLHVRGDQRMR